MADSTDMFGETPEDEAPSAAELEAAGQASMFGDPAPPPPASAPPAATPSDGAVMADVQSEDSVPWAVSEPPAVAEPAPAPETPAPEPPVAASPATPAPAPKAAAAVAQPYRVLARKYRPQTFSQLIGQDAMVQTLANAIRRERLAHAFLMTGVRGVGKTSTARLIAKALNCIGPDGQGGPTIDPCGQCEPCVAIAEGRHIDVIEMDAASHTGVDDVREIIEAVRYAAVSARYKIYIIDEVHMLSRNAFNALLKTLEEPPAHVKFLFATTEVDKLPVTVLSRCQRFDLRRIATPMLAQHFDRICGAEGVEAEEEALAMVAAAAEGSVRDGLSILDQAIAHADLDGGGRVTAAKVRDMLGLADRSVQRRLFSALLAGDGATLLGLVKAQFALGVEPLALVRGCMDVTHKVTVAQLGGGMAEASSAEERAAVEQWAGTLSPGQLHRLWQLLLKGFDEVRSAPDPLVAAEMALLRVMHASDLPDPGTLVKRLEDIASRPASASAPAASGAPAGGAVEAAPAPAPVAQAGPDWKTLVRRVERSEQLRIAQIMHDWVRPVSVADAVLCYELVPGYPGDPTSEVRDALLRATGERWEVNRQADGGKPSLREEVEADKARAAEELRRSPLVEAAFAAFPGAEFVSDDAPAAASAGRNTWRNRA